MGKNLIDLSQKKVKENKKRLQEIVGRCESFDEAYKKYRDSIGIVQEAWCNRMGKLAEEESKKCNDYYIAFDNFCKSPRNSKSQNIWKEKAIELFQKDRVTKSNSLKEISKYCNQALLLDYDLNTYCNDRYEEVLAETLQKYSLKNDDLGLDELAQQQGRENVCEWRDKEVKFFNALETTSLRKVKDEYNKAPFNKTFPSYYNKTTLDKKFLDLYVSVSQKN